MSHRETGEQVSGRPDYALLVLTGVLTITGLITVYSASFVIGLAQYGDPNYFILRQGLWAALGLTLMLAAMQLDYRILRTLAMPIMAITIVMLLAVLVVGSDGGGARPDQERRPRHQRSRCTSVLLTGEARLPQALRM